MYEEFILFPNSLREKFGDPGSKAYLAVQVEKTP